jgi:hypothetical protein
MDKFAIYLQIWSILVYLWNIWTKEHLWQYWHGDLFKCPWLWRSRLNIKFEVCFFFVKKIMFYRSIFYKNILIPMRLTLEKRKRPVYPLLGGGSCLIGIYVVPTQYMSNDQVSIIKCLSIRCGLEFWNYLRVKKCKISSYHHVLFFVLY